MEGFQDAPQANAVGPNSEGEMPAPANALAGAAGGSMAVSEYLSDARNLGPKNLRVAGVIGYGMAGVLLEVVGSTMEQVSDGTYTPEIRSNRLGR